MGVCGVPWRAFARHADDCLAFVTELGMELEGKAHIEGLWADRTVGLDGVRGY